MQTTQYWMTFTAGADATREVLAVRIVFELSDDHTTGRAEVPAFGILIENDARALIRAIDAAQREAARRYAHLDLRLGAMTVATASETRPLAWADGDETVIAPDRYEAMLLNQNRREQDLARLADLFVDELAGAEEFSEFFDGNRADSTGRPVDVEMCDTVDIRDSDYLGIVGPTVQASIEDVAHLEAIDRRGVDDGFALEAAHAPGGFGFSHASSDGLLPRQTCFFFVDDLAGKDAQRNTQLATNGEGPSGKVAIRINDDSFTGLLGHPWCGGGLVDNVRETDEVGTGLSILPYGHLVRLVIEVEDHDTALAPRRSTSIVGYDQNLAGPGCIGKHLFAVHSNAS